MSVEHARRLNKPRYTPQAPRRSVPVFDPNRAEKMHPTWCPCPACNHDTPAEPRRAWGCNLQAAAILAGAAIAFAVPSLGSLGNTAATVLVVTAGPVGLVLLLFGKHFS